MAVDDAARWDSRYAGHAIASPRPPDVVESSDLLDIVPGAGRALDVACGAGAQSVWMAQRGLEVVAIDASPAAIDLTTSAAGAAGVGERVEVRVVDLDRGIPSELGNFDVIVCQRFRGVDLYDSFITRLRPGGLCIVTVLSRTGAASPGAFHAAPRELLTAFTRPDAEILLHTERDGQESVVARTA